MWRQQASAGVDAACGMEAGGRLETGRRRHGGGQAAAWSRAARCSLRRHCLLPGRILAGKKQNSTCRIQIPRPRLETTCPIQCCSGP